MNDIGQGLRDENRLRALLGEGEPGLHVLLGGGIAQSSAFGGAAGGGGRVFALIAGEVRLAGSVSASSASSSTSLKAGAIRQLQRGIAPGDS